MQILCGGMAELVDALDSKSCSLWECQFKSDYPYQFEKTEYFSVFFLFKSFFILTFKRKFPHIRIKYLAYRVRMDFLKKIVFLSCLQ